MEQLWLCWLWTQDNWGLCTGLQTDSSQDDFHSAHLHGQDPGSHLRGTQAPQEVVKHLARGLFICFGSQQQVLQASKQLPLFLLSLWSDKLVCPVKSDLGYRKQVTEGIPKRLLTWRFLARWSLLSPSSSSSPEVDSSAASWSRNSQRHCTGRTSKEPSLDWTRSASHGIDCDEAWEGWD